MLSKTSFWACVALACRAWPHARSHLLHVTMEKVYLDYNATTPLAPEVLEAITSALRDAWGNPSSSYHAGSELGRVKDQLKAAVPIHHVM